jgi:2-polyprenyl-6-methoxyphenol hydroxylase-like FAD-dependent oxidoreductase
MEAGRGRLDTAGALRHYGEPIAWTFEPKVAESILRGWLKDAGVEVLFGHRVDSVRKEGARIRGITTLDGTSFEAEVFIDTRPGWPRPWRRRRTWPSTAWTSSSSRGA